MGLQVSKVLPRRLGWCLAGYRTVHDFDQSFCFDSVVEQVVPISPARPFHICRIAVEDLQLVVERLCVFAHRRCRMPRPDRSEVCRRYTRVPGRIGASHPLGIVVIGLVAKH